MGIDGCSSIVQGQVQRLAVAPEIGRNPAHISITNRKCFCAGFRSGFDVQAHVIMIGTVFTEVGRQCFPGIRRPEIGILRIKEGQQKNYVKGLTGIHVAWMLMVIGRNLWYPRGCFQFLKLIGEF